MHIHHTSIALHEVRFHAFHGVGADEQRVGSNFRVNVVLNLGLTEDDLRSDRLENTLNYADVYKVLADEMRQTSQLIEHVAWRTARSLLDTFPRVESLSLTIEKENPPMGADCRSAAFTLHASRNEL